MGDSDGDTCRFCVLLDCGSRSPRERFIQILKLSRRRSVLIQFVAALATAFNPYLAFAYEHALSDEAIRDAYFIGQDVKNVNTFLSRYLRGLPVPPSGPHVSEIQLSTPYAQVVEASALHSVGYSSQQAAEDYRKRGDSIAVRVKVLFTPAYPGGAIDFWRLVSVGLIQRGKHMAATSVSGQPIYASDIDGGSWAIGADVFVTFSVAGVKSDNVQVEVIPPEGAPVHATFDLNSLK